jgi:2-haloacid dehalogenase
MALSDRDTVVFDVVGTLFDVSALDEPLAEVGAAPATRAAWFARLLHHACALSLVGEYAPFREVATTALRSVLCQQELDPAKAEDVVAKLAGLPPHPEARPALERLRHAGLRVVTLTNSGEEQTRELLAENGLADFVQEILTVEDVRVYKPDPRVYRMAAERLDREPGSLVLVAAHGWDVLGALSAGWDAVWVDKLEKVWPLPVDEPERRAADLDEAARLIAG